LRLQAFGDSIAPFTLETAPCFNDYNLGGHIPAAELHAAARTRGGALVRFDHKGGTVQE
jgi:hypothetical protein